jgi:cytochrome c biogenesis protein CcdA/thiol-disulfide isomerase/thioredoxin
MVLTSGVSRRPVLVVAGLVLSFAVSTLLGSLVLSALDLPQDILRDAGIAVLILIGLGLLVPRFGDLLERPFARLRLRRSAASRPPHRGGFVLGLGLGLLYVPCAGPVLAAIAVVGATHHVGWRAALLTAAFGIGAGVPLLVLALAGDALTGRVRALRQRAPAVRAVSGVVMIAMALVIGFNLTDGLQRSVPDYVNALQNSVEGNSAVTKQLGDLTKHGAATKPTRAPAGGSGATDLGGQCRQGGTEPENCGRAPAFTKISSWLNTPGDKPLTLSALRGKVVLIDFWTYSCINCQRALPHVEAWYRSYAKAGLVVVGVHTPEFAFEHVRSNVSSQSAALGVKYPVAIDNDYGTWNAYNNQYWPAEYLIDATGNIRHVAFGEGDYGNTELQIRQLLEDAHPGVALPRSTDVATADLGDVQTPETYLGYRRGGLHNSSGTTLHPNKTYRYGYPGRLDPDAFALSGTWTQRSEYVSAGPDAALELSYAAKKAYLVLGGTGTVRVSIDGRTVRTVTVSGPPTLYPLYSAAAPHRRTLRLSATAGVQAYSFTFG